MVTDNAAIRTAHNGRRRCCYSYVRSMMVADYVASAVCTSVQWSQTMLLSVHAYNGRRPCCLIPYMRTMVADYVAVRTCVQWSQTMLQFIHAS